MVTIRDIYDVLFAAAPAYMKEPWDNVGLLCGHMDAQVSRVLVALDASLDVLQEARACGCELIVTHHPLIFDGLKAVNDQNAAGRALLYLIENGIAAINLHTNLDCAPGGVNDILARKLGLENVQILSPKGTDEQGRPYGLIRMGEVPETTVCTFAAQVKQALGCSGVRFTDAGKAVHKVAVGGGSCGSEIESVLQAGCDTFVTADIKYHQFLDAQTLGLNLVDAGHFQTENPVCEYLVRCITDALPELDVRISEKHTDKTQFL